MTFTCGEDCPGCTPARLPSEISGLSRDKAIDCNSTIKFSSIITDGGGGGAYYRKVIGPSQQTANLIFRDAPLLTGRQHTQQKSTQNSGGKLVSHAWYFLWINNKQSK